MGFNILEFELEGYKDTSVGTIVFNKTNLPQNRCQHFHSVANISDGLLFRSKSNSFFIYKYSRDGESIAITLHHNIKTCGKKFYHTSIPGVYVVLLEDNEGFLENNGLSLVEMEDDTMFEAEIHRAMNTVELSNDEHYMDINFRACELARQNIITAQPLLKEDLEIVRDRKGRPLSTHVNGEAVTMYKCHPMMVRIRHDELRCCQEMPIWHGKNYSISAFLQPVRKKVTEVCTPRICNKFDNPLFNIGSAMIPNWVRIEDGDIKKAENQEFVPQSHSREKQIVTRPNSIYSNKQKIEYKKFNLIKNTRSLIKEEIIHTMYPMKVMNSLEKDIEMEDFSINDYISNHLQEAFLPWPLSTIHLLPDWVILTRLVILGIFLAKVFADPFMAVCHLLRGSSLSATEKLSSIIIPTTTITRLSIREQKDIESGRVEEVTFEVRMVTLEKRVNMIQTLIIKEKEKNNESI